MEVIDENEQLYEMLSLFSTRLDEIQRSGESNGSSQYLKLHEWLINYIAIQPSDSGIEITSLDVMNNYENLPYADWHDRVALLPLMLLAKYGYPEWETAPTLFMEKCLVIAGDKSSGRHSLTCFETEIIGDDDNEKDEACLISDMCVTKNIFKYAHDLASAMMMLALEAEHESNDGAAKKARFSARVIGNILVKGKIVSEEDYNKFLDDERKSYQTAFWPENYHITE